MVAVSTVAPGLHDRYERYHPRMREINTLDLLLHVMQHHTAFEGERAQMRATRYAQYLRRLEVVLPPI